MDVTIKERVHELYWKHDINCARTVLTCLCELFHVNLEAQTSNAAIGLHGAGGYRAQCGLVEGALMFIGIYFSQKGKSDSDIAALCYQYADEFTERYSSLKCTGTEALTTFHRWITETGVAATFIQASPMSFGVMEKTIIRS